MISNSIPVSFLCCCLFFLSCSDNLLSVQVERGILHWVWRGAGLFSGEDKLRVLSKAETPRSSILCLHISPNAARPSPEGNLLLLFPEEGITDPGLSHRKMNKWNWKEEHSRQLDFITFWFSHPELQSDSKHCYLCVLGGCETALRTHSKRY